MPRPLLVWTLAVLLAGCGSPRDAAGPAAERDDQDSVLHGLVVDEAIRPILGATVTLVGLNLSATTEVSGEFAFPDTLPREQPLVMIVTADGFQSTSRQASLPPVGGMELTITMRPAPSDEGYSQVLHFTGFLSCQGSVATGEDDPHDVQCHGNAVPMQDSWEFAVDPGLLTAIVEVTWTSAQPLAEGLGANLTKVDLPGPPLSETVGRTPLRLVIPQLRSAQLFANGGDIRLVVYAQPITDEDEQAVAASVAVNQQFDAYASLFYGVPPDPSYSFVGEA